MKLVITTSSGERTAWSPAPDETFSTKTRSTGPDSACQSGTLLTTPPSTRRRPPCTTIGKTPGQRGAREERGLQRSRREHDLLAGVEVGGDDPQRDLEIGERAGRGGVVDERGQAVVAEEVGAAAHDVPGPVDPPAGEDVVGLELLPHRRELGDAGEVGRVGDGGAVERAGRGPDHDVGHDAPFEQRPQHADLADALVAAAGQNERGARSRRLRRAVAPGDRRETGASFPSSVHRPVRGAACGGSSVDISRTTVPRSRRYRSRHRSSRPSKKPFDTVRHWKTGPAYTPPDPETTRQRKRA